MAHWAEIGNRNIVLRVVVTNNDDPNGDEGYQWLVDNLGGTWIKTSYNTFGGEHLLGGTPLRMNFASVGGTYDKRLDAFIPPKTYPSWILDAWTCRWVAPVPVPEDDLEEPHVWDEPTRSWKLLIGDLQNPA